MDIVERLNEMIGKGEYYEPEFEQAKAEIERLRIRNKRLRVVLIAVKDCIEDRSYIDAEMIIDSALQQKESE